MSRARISMFMICICFAALTQSMWGQTRAGSRPTAGANLPRPNVVVDDLNVALPALTTFTGTLQFTITITVKSLHLSTLTCEASADVIDENTSTFMVTGTFEEAASISVAVAPTTTCVVKIPYSWALANATTDTVSVGYGITAVGPAANGSPTRFNSHSLAAIKIPANGATTSINIAATI